MNTQTPIAAANSPKGDNQQASSGSPANAFRETECDDCEGTGFFVGAAYHPDDPRIQAQWDCDACDGTGEVEAADECEGSGVFVTPSPMSIEEANARIAAAFAPTGWELAEQSLTLGAKR